MYLCFKKRMIVFLEAIDIFSYSPSLLFSFKGKFRYSTMPTKLMTIIVGILTIISFFYFSTDYLSKSNPLNILSEEYSKNPKEVTMNREKFLFMVSLENYTDNFKPFIDESIYNIKAEIETKEIDGKITYTPLRMRICNETHIPSNDPELQKYFKNSYYESMYCFDDYSQIILNGTWDSEVFKNVKIQIQPCYSSNPDNNSCQSQKIIKNYLEGGFLVMRYTSVRTDLNNYENPLKVFAVDDFQPTSLKMAANMYLYFGQVKIETKNDILKSEPINHEGMNMLSSKYGLYEKRSESDAFMTIFLRLATTTRITKRKYDNILDVLYKVGGIIRIITFICSLLLKPFLEKYLLQTISNETFDYENLFKLEEKKKEKRKLNETYHSNKIKLSIWDYMKSIFKTKNKKIKILMKSIKIMKENLDISFLINRLLDIEKIKMIEKKEEFEIIKNLKPRVIIDEININNMPFSSEIEKKFTQTFLIQSEPLQLNWKRRNNIIKENEYNFSFCDSKQKSNDISNNDDLSFRLKKLNETEKLDHNYNEENIENKIQTSITPKLMDNEKKMEKL